MNKKHAGELSLTDKIWLLAKDSLELQALQIGVISLVVDNNIQVACANNSFTHKPIFSNRTDLKAGYAYFDTDTQSRYYCNRVDCLEELLARLNREKEKLSTNITNIQNQIAKTNEALIKQKA